VKLCNTYSIVAMGTSYFVIGPSRSRRRTYGLIVKEAAPICQVFGLWHILGREIPTLCRRCPSCSQNMTRSPSADEIANVKFF